MRRTLLVLLVLLISSATRALAAPVGIVPGVGIGKLQLGMTRAAALKVMGAPHGIRSLPPLPGVERDAWDYNHDESIWACYKNGRIVQIGTSAVRDASSSGLHPGSTLAECLKRFPAARKKRVPHLSQDKGAGYAYDDVQRGIAFELPSTDEQHDGKTVNVIVVHRRGVPIITY